MSPKPRWPESFIKRGHRYAEGTAQRHRENALRRWGIGMMHPSQGTTNCANKPPEDSRSQRMILFIGCRGSVALPTLNFKLLASRSVRWHNSAVLSHLSVVLCYGSARKQDTWVSWQHGYWVPKIYQESREGGHDILKAQLWKSHKSNLWDSHYILLT